MPRSKRTSKAHPKTPSKFSTIPAWTDAAWSEAPSGVPMERLPVHAPTQTLYSVRRLFCGGCQSGFAVRMALPPGVESLSFFMADEVVCLKCSDSMRIQ